VVPDRDVLPGRADFLPVDAVAGDATALPGEHLRREHVQRNGISREDERPETSASAATSTLEKEFAVLFTRAGLPFARFRSFRMVERKNRFDRLRSRPRGHDHPDGVLAGPAEPE
jgi:hypothetical protein